MSFLDKYIFIIKLKRLENLNQYKYDSGLLFTLIIIFAPTSLNKSAVIAEFLNDKKVLTLIIFKAAFIQIFIKIDFFLTTITFLISQNFSISCVM